VGWAALARASPVRVRVEQEADLPFAADELRAAVALRLPERGEALEVTVAPAAPGRVVLDARGRRMDLWIGDRTGGEAARLVAILIVDAVRAPVELGDLPPPRGRWSLFLAPAVGLFTDAGVSFEPTAGLGWSLGRRGRLLLSLGYARALVEDPRGRLMVAVEVVPVRAGAGLSAGPLELQAGVVAQGYRAVAGTARTGVRPGGWLALACWLPGTRWARPFLAAGADLYGQRLELRLDGRPALTAGQVGPWAALGVTFGAGP
jgi:hypothetical protein